MSVVLLVDDSEDIREMMIEFLDGEGFDVLEACNGLEALEVLHSATVTVDLVMLDLAMPVMDGMEFMRVMERDPQHSTLPIIMISATPQPVQLSPSAVFMKKPLDLDALLQLARTYCPKPTS